MKRAFFLISILFIFFTAACLAQYDDLNPPDTSQLSNIKGLNNKKISLDIKGMDIIDVLKILSQRAGLNLVVGKNVTGRVTLFLKDVSVADAFDIVILSSDLAYEIQGQVINVMTQRDYELEYGERFQDKKKAEVVQLKYAKAADLARALNQIKTNVGKIVVDEGSNMLSLIDTPEKIDEMMDFIQKTDLPLETRVFSLNYAPADKLSAKLQDSLTKGVGSLRIDERTNKIIVTDYPGRMDEIAKIVNAFDEKTQQVLIDAQIIELTPSDKFEMGVDWDYWIKKYFQISAHLPINPDNALILGTDSNPVANPPTPPSAPGKYNAILDLLRTIGDTKILSSPRIMALNNQESKIMVGRKDAYITATTTQGGSGNTVTSQSVNFVDTGIKLYVTPTINRDGFVTMKIRPEISSAESQTIQSGGQNNTVPIVTTSEAETTVMVKDGITIIIGGLKKNQRTYTQKRIPILGDIPWLGYLFGSTSDQVTKSELVILLTPHIMSGDKSFTDFAEIKPVNGAVAEMVNGKIVTEKFSSGKTASPDISNALRKAAVSEYYNLLSRRINEIMALYPPQDLTGWVTLNFSLNKDGSLAQEPEVVESSDASLNPYALEALKNASPFPPLPKELQDGTGEFKISLSYN